MIDTGQSNELCHVSHLETRRPLAIIIRRLDSSICAEKTRWFGVV